MEIQHPKTDSLPRMPLGDRDIHIWYTSLRPSAEVVHGLQHTLSEDELARAARFYFAHDREAFIVARGVLRCLLAGYVNAKPEQMIFGYEAAGKPYLAGRFADQIFFNLSHSRDRAVFAFGRQPQIGIDIEFIRPMDDFEQIAAGHFSAKENAQFRSLPKALTPEGFFNCWTRKEAFVKALGTGISYPLQDFDVSLRPGEPARLVCIAGSEAEAARWTMADLKFVPEYAAAVVVEGSDHVISRIQEFDITNP